MKRITEKHRIPECVGLFILLSIRLGHDIACMEISCVEDGCSISYPSVSLQNVDEYLLFAIFIIIMIPAMFYLVSRSEGMVLKLLFLLSGANIILWPSAFILSPYVTWVPLITNLLNLLNCGALGRYIIQSYKQKDVEGERGCDEGGASCIVPVKRKRTS